MNPREKTNFITQLVKIVVKEEIQIYYEAQIKIMESKSAFFIEKTAELFENIYSKLNNAGRIWPKSEDILLIEEVEIALDTIAKNHGRTTEAIRSRIMQKELLGY